MLYNTIYSAIYNGDDVINIKMYHDIYSKQNI